MRDPAAPGPSSATASPARCPVAHADVHSEAPEAGCPVPQPPGRPRTSACAYSGSGKRGYFVPGIIALFVLLVGGAIINGAALSHAPPTRLDGSHVASQIATTYQNNHQLTSPPPVTCPNNEPVAPGLRFECQLLRARGGPLSIEVTQTGGGQFTYRVGA